MPKQPLDHEKALAEYWRKATPAELDFYRTKLYPLQDRVFEVASLYEDAIYLTGGTALARFFFDHRLSEDLDFFTLIVPCGIEDHGVTSLEAATGRALALPDIETVIVRQFCAVFDRELSVIDSTV